MERPLSSAWTGPRARRQLIIASLIVLASVAIFAFTMVRGAQELGGKAAPQAETYTLIEVRPPEGANGVNGVNGSKTAFSQQNIQVAGAVSHVVAVQRYVTGRVKAVNVPELQVTGVDVRVPLRLPGSEAGGSGTTAPRIVKGRAFGAEDAERAVAVIGQEYARVGKTIYGYEIEGMMDHNPPIKLNDIEVRVIGMFSTGSGDHDSQVFVPLATAERLFGMPGQASGLYLQVDSPDNVAQVVRDLKVALGEKVNVKPMGP